MNTNSNPSVFGLSIAAASIFLAAALVAHSRVHELQFEQNQARQHPTHTMSRPSQEIQHASYNADGSGL